MIEVSTIADFYIKEVRPMLQVLVYGLFHLIE